MREKNKLGLLAALSVMYSVSGYMKKDDREMEKEAERMGMLWNPAEQGFEKRKGIVY